MGITAALLCLASLLVLLPPCPLTRVFHIASEQFNTPCPSSCYPDDAPVDASTFDYAAAGCDACPRNAVWLAYQQPAPFGGGGAPSAAMGFPFRLRCGFHRAAAAQRKNVLLNVGLTSHQEN